MHWSGATAYSYDRTSFLRRRDWTALELPPVGVAIWIRLLVLERHHRHGGTGQLSAIGPPWLPAAALSEPPAPRRVAAAPTAMSSTLILDVKRAPLPTGRPKLLGARFRPRSVVGQSAGRGGDVVDAGQVGILQRNVVGHRRNEGAGDP